MLTRGDGGSGPPLRSTPEQVYVMLGPLVAATARDTGRHETTTSTTTTDLLRASHNPNKTSPLDRLAAVAASGHYQTYSVNAATSPGVLAGLPPTLNTTHQLIQNLLAADHNNSTTTTIDHFANHLQHNLTTSNQTSSGGGRGPFTSFEWLMIVTLVTIILISIVGNLLVCVAIFTDRRLRKLGNAFIVSLAIADLFVSFLVMTFALHNDLMEEWIFGAWFCDIWISFDIMCCTASILNLCAISLDRFIHIKDCLLYNQLMTRRVAISAVIMIWIISGLVSFVPITLGWHKPSSGSLVAHSHPPDLHLATTQLPIDLIRSVGGEDYREGDRAKRAAGHLSLPRGETTNGTGGERRRRQQFARQLNYSAASDPSRWLRHHVPQANEPIGSADTSGRRWQRRLNITNATQVADKEDDNRSGGRGRGEDDKERQEEEEGEEDKQAQMQFILMRRQFDQSNPATMSHLRSRPQVATRGREERRESNLGEGKPLAVAPAEHIKHLPSEARRRRRRRQLESLAATAAATAKLASDYEEDEPPSHGGGAGREQTNGGSHTQRRPFDSNGRARDEVTDGAGRANGEDEHPSSGRAQMPPPSPPAAQCMLTLTPTYAVISSTISFYIPCIIMLGLYSKLFACARRHVRNIKAISKAPQPIGQGCADGGNGRGTSAIATRSANTNNYNGAGASEAANNNHISTSSESRTARSSASGGAGRGPAGPLTPMVHRARRLIGGARATTGNQRKDGCITETDCGELESGAAGKQPPHPGGKLARLVGGARARTWIKFRGDHQTKGGGGESASQNSTISDGRSPRAPSASAKDNAELGKSVATSDKFAAGGPADLPEQRLVLKSILSNQYLVKQQQQQQQRCSLSGDSVPMGAPQHGTEDNTVTRGSATGDGGGADAELEPFLANAAGNERKSVVSTNATGVKLNMFGGAACDAVGAVAGAGASAASRSQMWQNQRSQQQQQCAQPLQPTKQQTSQLATHKAAITLGIIMGTFLLCWLPFFCLNIIKAFYADLIPAWLFRAFTWLGYANSALNPIIYGIHNSEFRNAFNRIFFKHLTLKNGRQYLNRRFSYDLRPHNNNNNNHRHHHHQNNPTAGVANWRGHGNQSQQSDANNNNSQQSGPAVALVAAVANKTTANAQRRPNQLVGLARGESYAQNNKQQPLDAGARATSNNLHHNAATTTSVKNNRAQGRTCSSSLAMSSSLEQYHGNQQECLNLLNCLQERGGHSASTAPSISNTTVHRTSEDLSHVKVAASNQVTATETAAEEQQLQQIQPQSVAIT